MFVVKGNTKEPRQVSVEQRHDGVVVVVNGNAILKLADNDNRVIILCGADPEATGLRCSRSGVEVSPGHVLTVWDSDQESSRGRY